MLLTQLGAQLGALDAGRGSPDCINVETLVPSNGLCFSFKLSQTGCMAAHLPP